MKLLKQTKLVFQEGRSDKVYEVDLCEVGANRYVVNFRYGRRDATLKEGTKTNQPVALTEAEKIFALLVNEKSKKGYQDEAKKATTPKTADVWGAQKSTFAYVDDARRQAVLKRLAEGDKAKQKKGWNLERAIWRAGELKIKEAAPILVQLLGSKDDLRDYTIIWALGFCGDESCVPALGNLYQNSSKPDYVRRIACEALLKLSDDKTQAEFRNDLFASLPEELRRPATAGSADDFLKVLQAYLEAGDHSRFQVLDTIYLIDSDAIRPALLNILRNAPLKPNYFRAFRHIFKAAEYRCDAEVFGMLAYRFEKTKANFTSWHPLNEKTRHPQWIYVGGNSHQTNYVQDGQKEIQSLTSRIAYGSRTRAYLRNRVWRTLRRLGELGDLNYVNMAVGVLLPFSEADSQTVRVSSYYNWNERKTVEAQWDDYAPYKAFNHILYTNSPRYQLRGNSTAWRCRPDYKPGDAAPVVREEAFPILWEKRPEGLLHLIAESSCRPVIEFATRALTACEEFCAKLDLDTILMILERPYEETAKLGLKLAKQHYNPLAPNKVLTLMLANCAYTEARAEAHRWIQHSGTQFISDDDFVCKLVFSNYADTREFARHWLRAATIADSSATRLLERFFAQLLSLSPSQDEMAKDVENLIVQCFGKQLRTLNINTVLLLLNHRMVEVQELGGTILLNHETKAAALPEEIINSLIASPFETIRGIGMKLFGQLDIATLFQRDGVIAAFAMHELEDIRNSIRPVIRQLCLLPDRPAPRNDNGPPIEVDDPLTAEQHKDFSLRLSARLFNALLAKETPDGVQSTLSKIMREDVGVYWMQKATRGTAWQLVTAKSGATQELGGVLLSFKANDDYTFAQDFDFTELVELTNHEVLTVRQSSRMLFSKMLHRLKSAMNPEHHVGEMLKAIKLLDAKWDDSRDFWFGIFEVHFDAQDFTPAILVSICDSVNPAVQAFGRKLITRYFAEADGQEYLLKLSEHPSADLQLFATNWLERYAAGNSARLNELRHYFLSVLSRVNKARVAKSRVLAFLTDEAQKSEEAAQIVAEILTRQSLTMAIGDKAAAIEAMLKIRQHYPQIHLPLQVKQPEARNAF
jgi:predicted DNA-binding WGR domain protein